MSRTFTGKITKEQLMESIAYAVSKHEYFQNEFESRDQDFVQGDAKDFLRSGGFWKIAKELTPKVKDDLSKLEFDGENVEWEVWHENDEDEENDDDEGDKRVGFKTLPSGLMCLSIMSCGDWEYPIYYVIYYDGTKLRAYIPSGGNHYNRKTKKAYGNDDDVDTEISVFEHCQYEDLDKNGDADAVVYWKDVEGHIVKREGKFVEPKGMKDIDSKYFVERDVFQETINVGIKYVNDLEKFSSYLPKEDLEKYLADKSMFDLIKKVLEDPNSSKESVEHCLERLKAIQDEACREKVEPNTIYVNLTKKVSHMDILDKYVESQDRSAVIKGILSNPNSTTEDLESAFDELQEILNKREEESVDDNVGYFKGR